MNIKAIHTDINIGSVDFYEVQPLLTAQQRLYNKSF